MGRRAAVEFRLRFPTEEIESIAARYSYADDTEPLNIGRAIRRRGWAEREELMTLGRWKSARLTGHLSGNTDTHIREATAIALTAETDAVRVGVLMSLSGVGLPMASVLLHVAHLEPYPILDQRALWSLGFDETPSWYSQSLWTSYVRCCRDLSNSAHVDMRTLDRALWQFSKEHQPGTLG